jgi:hypothetical protein
MSFPRGPADKPSGVEIAGGTFVRTSLPSKPVKFFSKEEA